MFALPALLTNPAVFGYLLEFAALSREGVTPTEFFAEEAKNGEFGLGSLVVGDLGVVGRLAADSVEFVLGVFSEKPAF